MSKSISPLASIAGDAVSSIIGSGLSYLGSSALMDKQQRYNRENMREQYRYGQMSERNSYSNMVQGSLAAGLNPAFDGSSPVGASMPSSSNPSATFEAQPLNPLQAVASSYQLESLQEQTRAQRIANDMADIDLLNKRAGYETWNEDGHFVDDEGKPLLDDAAIAAYKSAHRGQIPEFVKSVSVGNEGRADARQRINELLTLGKEQSARQSEADARSVEARLNRLVSEYRLNSPSVVSAVASMPAKEYEYLSKRIENVGLVNAYQELVNTKEGATNVPELIKSLKGEGSFGDKFLAVLAFIAQAITNNSSISVKW